MASEDLKVIGKSIPIREARNKVTGRAEFVDDMEAELYVKVLGSPHPHAMIKNIDTSRAENMQGVKVVLTYDSLLNRPIHFSCHRSSDIMDDHLRYVGDYVAAVAATSEAIAEEAIDNIEVEYEVLPAVFDPEEAADPDAPKLYPEGNDYGGAQDMPIYSQKERSLQEWGDIDKGFAEADVIVEDTFDVTPQVHSAIETHVCMAGWDGNELTIWNATQTPWELQMIAADYFQLPVSKVVVLSPYVGGGFGGKYTGRYQFVPCMLSKMAGGKLTKLALTREETQTYARRPRGKLSAKIGARNDGTITAIHFMGWFDVGAYGNFHGGSNDFHLEGGVLSYKTANAKFEAKDMHTNHFRGECMRSVQVPLIAFAVESVIDQVVEKLGMDPIEFRLKNMPETGDMMPPTAYTGNFGMYPEGKLDIYPGRQMMQEVLEKIDWKNKWKGFGKPSSVDGSKQRGVGLAYCMGYGGFYGDGGTRAQVTVNLDGSITIYSGSQDIGQGINTALCMLAAEAFGIAPDEVNIITGDSRSGQYDIINARSSHQLATGGHVLLMAAEDAKQKIRRMAAPLFGAEPDDIEIGNKNIWVKENPDGAVPLQYAFGTLASPVTGTAQGPLESIYPEVKPGYKAKQPMIAAAEVEVDIDTGAVTPIKLVTGMFPGKMINQGIVRGQAIGGAAQSLGMALWEEVKFNYEEFAYLNRDFTDYRIPRAKDMPEIDTVLIEEVDEESPPEEGLPYGGRGIGEMAAWGAVAFASAIYNATGVRIKTSPMTAETVLDALNKEAAK
jgi:xanthine dehydrogenase molybdenum-binding subunit